MISENLYKEAAAEGDPEKGALPVIMERLVAKNPLINSFGFLRYCICVRL